MSEKPEIPADYSSLDFSSNWPLKCFQREVEGTILGELVDFNPDTLILDFVDDRYNLMRVGAGYITLSVEVLQSGAIGTEWYKAGALVHRLSQECQHLWLDALKKFAELLRSHLPNTKIIVHDAPWSSLAVPGTDLLSGNARQADQKQQIHDSNIVNVDQFDRLMKFYAASALLYIPSAKKLATPRETHVRAEQHIWGEAPFHYVREYYAEAAAQLVGHGITFALSPR